MTTMRTVTVARFESRLTMVAMTALFGVTGAACGMARPMEMPTLTPYETQPSAPVLTENHFKRDVMGDLDETQLRAILGSPVFLEEKARIGVLPVESGYGADPDVPIDSVPGALEQALTESGHFEVVSEVTTDWPHAGSLGGMRELAARYRAEYLLLYRSRFVSRSHANGWAVTWLTILGGLVFPHRTIEVAGVMEATMLDVKTGTILFTAFERVYRKSDENVWQNDRKRAAMKQDLQAKATKPLTEKVLDQVRRLAAARPKPQPELRPAAGEPTPAAIVQ